MEAARSAPRPRERQSNQRPVRLATDERRVHGSAEEIDHAIGEVSFENQGRSRVIHENRGLLRLYGAHGTGLFLGAEMIGPAAEHIGHLLAWAAQQGLSVHEMLALPYYHPTIEEGVRTGLRDLSRQLRMGPELVPQCLDCGPGG